MHCRWLRAPQRRLALGCAIILFVSAVGGACGDGSGLSDERSAGEIPAASTDQQATTAAAEGEEAPPSTVGAPPDAAPNVSQPQVGPQADAPSELLSEPLFYIIPRAVFQGEVFLVAVDAPGAGFAAVAYNGQVFTLLREGDRFFAILPVDALSPTGPLPVVLSLADADGRLITSRETLVTVTDSAWETEVVEIDSSNSALLDPVIEAEDRRIRDPVMRQETPERHWSGIFDPPPGIITSNFGLLRSYNLRPPTEYHPGLDFAGSNGDPILAPNDGVVAWVGQTQRRGNGIIVDHGGGVFSGYYHLSEVLTAPGTVVHAGDLLGRMGATGLATGPHLHWEIVVHGVPVDPVQWIRSLRFPDPTAAFDEADAIAPPVPVGG